MIVNVSKENYNLFLKGCENEVIFGARCITEYAVKPQNVFMQINSNGNPSTVMFLDNGVMVLASDNTGDLNELCDFFKSKGVKQIDTNLEQCMSLKEIMPGATESSYYMHYKAEKPNIKLDNIKIADDLHDVLTVLQESHEYYRAHYTYPVWSVGLIDKINAGVLDLYIMYNDEGRPIATGSISAQSDEYGVISAIAVIPEYRLQGIGNKITLYMTDRIIEQNKKPCLISGYDEVSNLYAKIGYERTARWGELYL